MEVVYFFDLLAKFGLLTREDEYPDLYVNIKTMEAFDNRYKADAHPNDKHSKAVKGKSKGKMSGLKPEWVGYKIGKTLGLEFDRMKEYLPR